MLQDNPSLSTLLLKLLLLSFCPFLAIHSKGIATFPRPFRRYRHTARVPRISSADLRALANSRALFRDNPPEDLRCLVAPTCRLIRAGRYNAGINSYSWRSDRADIFREYISSIGRPPYSRRKSFD